MRKFVYLAAAVLALAPLAAIAPASAVVTHPASAVADAASTPQPDGGGTGWTLVENQTGSDIYSSWTNVSGLENELCDSKGTVAFNGTAVELTTNGSANGNCARLASPWTIAPTTADPSVFIEYEATLPTNTWAALWARGDPGPWPNTGEIDTAEMLSAGSECHTYHYLTASGSDGSLGPGQPGRCESGTPGSEAVYGVEWDAGHLTFYVNGVELGHLDSSVITADPEQVVLDNKTGGFDPAPGPTATMDVYYVRAWYKASANVWNSGTPSTCLDANSNNYPNDGDAVQLYGCDSNGEQQWQITSAGQLENAQTGMCLDANSNNYPNDGDAIQLWACNGNGEQQWQVTSAGQLENAQTGMCLDANSNNYPNDGDSIQLWSCNTNPEQEWQLG